MDIPDTLLPGSQEKGHVGIPEPVDRLHRIAHQEERAAIAGLPSGREQFQKPDLGTRSILKFIHEDVLDASIKRKQQVRWPDRASQGPLGGQGQFDEIGGIAFGEQHPQFGYEVLQGTPKCRQRVPPCRSCNRPGGTSQLEQRMAQFLLNPQRRNQMLELACKDGEFP